VCEVYKSNRSNAKRWLCIGVRGRVILGSSTTRDVLSVLRKQIGGERSVHGFLDGLVRSTKTVMTRVELGGTLFLVAVIGVLLTSRKEGGKSD
jgi:hypothetical protein